METTFIGLSVIVWVYAGPPDSSVHTSGGSYADVGQFFMDTTNTAIYVCYQGGMSQLWSSTTNTALVQSLLVQSDWNESNPSAFDFIKNKPSLSTVAISGSYNDLSSKPSIPAAQIQSDWSHSNISLLDYIKNKPVLATVATSGSYSDLSSKPTIPAAQIQSDWTQTSSGSLDFIKNKPSSRSQSSASRSLNTIFQISSTRDSLVNYSVDISTAATLIGGQTGTVYLQISTSSTFASGIQELGRSVNGNSVSLAIAITVTQNVTGTMSGYVPSGYYCRLLTENTTGTPTFTYRSGQEVLV